MRTSKIISFSVPPEFEEQILAAAKNEHRTVSEFLREAIRQYLVKKRFDETRLDVSLKLKNQGIQESDVDDIIKNLRGGE